MSLLRVENLQNRMVRLARLELAAGEAVCLAGPSGSGKTLLLRALADLDPHAGRVWLDGREMTACAPCEWRRQVGLLPAESQWWHESVGAHFSTIIDTHWQTLEFGRDTLDWQVSRCSTGERQRLALLRLLANRPRVLLLDEPTAALDARAVGQVEQLVADYRKSEHAAVLWVSHDPQQQQRIARRQLRIIDGQVEEIT